MKAYKGFDKDLKCRDFQYEIGKEYKEDKAQVCNCGFHSCLNPMDVFSYYSPTDGNGNLNRFCEVEIPEVMDRSDGDSKVATKEIKIGAEIGLKGIIEAGVKFIFSKVDFENNKASNNEDYSVSTNTGYCSASTNTGDYSVSTNTGNRSVSTNTGYCSASTNTGDYSVSTNTGDYSASTVSGKDSIAIVTGYDSKAKGALGCYIVLAERDDNYNLLDVKAAKVDGEVIKADTFYKLINGEFVKVEE